MSHSCINSAFSRPMALSSEAGSSCPGAGHSPRVQRNAEAELKKHPILHGTKRWLELRAQFSKISKPSRADLCFRDREAEASTQFGCCFFGGDEICPNQTQASACPNLDDLVVIAFEALLFRAECSCGGVWKPTSPRWGFFGGLIVAAETCVCMKPALYPRRIPSWDPATDG